MTYTLQQRLDAFVNGECSPDALVQELSAFCETTPASTWDVLSLIDQYHRRGKLPVALFRTVKYKIERHVVGIQGRNTIREICHTANASTQAAVTAVPDDSGTIQEQTASTKELGMQISALRSEILRARAKVQRYRHRIAILSSFGRRHRSVLVKARRELEVSRGQAIVYLERLRTGVWRRSGRELPMDEADAASDTRDHLRRPRLIRLSQAVLSATFVFGVGAPPALRDLPKHVDAGNIALAVAAAPMSQITDPGIITLSTDRYVVFPGNASADIYVHRTGGTGGDVDFVWWAEASGAKPGKDYVSGKPKIAHMLEGVDSLQLSVPILANPLRKHTELFYVVIARPEGGASLGEIRRASVFIMRPD
jgi:hypothetical protein